MYLYMHRRHSALIPELEQALRDMKADGSYQEIERQTLNFTETE